MVSERVIDHIAETIRFEAGKANAVIETNATSSGYAIRLTERHDDEPASFYAGKDAEPTNDPNAAKLYDTPQQAWDAIIAEKVKPISADELPKVVYCGILYFVTEKEVV